MAPNPLVGRYKLYKQGTTKLVNWVADAAGRCCDIKSIIKSLDCGLINKPSTAKGKKGKAADPPSVEIRTRELVQLAEAIASTDTLDVPEKILQIAQEVIDGREACADWYAAQALQGDGALEKENQSHRYFILVLKKVFKLLKDKARSKSGANASSAPGNSRKINQSEKDKLANLFACLELEEPSASPLGTTGPRTTVSVPRTPPPVYKLEKDDEDPAFATWCFLQDLDDVRSFVRETWLEYARGTISFLAASTITDTAFGLLRCADEEFAKLSPIQTTNWRDMLQYFGLTWFTRDRTVWLCPATHGHNLRPSSNESKMNIVELLCPIAFMCLSSYSEDAGAMCGEMKRRKEHKGEAKDIPTSRFHHFHTFCCVLYKLAPELHDLSHQSLCSHIVLDEFVQGLADVHRTAKIPMWLVVACQIYLDVRDLLGTYIDHGVGALQTAFETHQRVAERVEQYRVHASDTMAEVSTALDTLDWVAKASNRFEQSIQLPPEEGHNHGPEHRDSRKTHAQIKQELGCAASTMERQLPAHTGAILQDLKVGMYSAGCKIANHGCLIISAAHLYKALRSTALLKQEWHDMDLVLASFGTKQPLVPKMGTTFDPKTAVQNYLTALGVRATGFSAEAHQRNSRSPLKESRKITISSPYLQAMSDRQKSWKKHGLGYSKSKAVEVVLQTLTVNSNKAATGNKTAARAVSRRLATFTPVQLLKTFKKTILADEPLLNFDYVSFMLDCADLIQAVAETSGPKLSVGAAAAGGYHMALVADLLGCSASHPALVVTAEVLQNHLADHSGNRLVKQAYDQSSGRIPKHLRPNIENKIEDDQSSRALFCAMFDYSDTQYTFSGNSMAAYHAKVKPELCTKECCGVPPAGSATDPNILHDGQKPLVAFGAAIPRFIIDEATANMRKDPKHFMRAREDLASGMFRQYEKGTVSEAFLRQITSGIMGMELVPDKAAKTGTTPWAYRLMPDNSMYTGIFEALVTAQGENPNRYGSPINMSADLIHGGLKEMFAV